MPPRLRRLLLIAAIVLLAAGLRYRAATRLPVDFDEPVYYRAGQHLAAAIRADGPAGLPDADIAPDIDDDAWREWESPLIRQYSAMGTVARFVSALFGVLHVLLLAAVSPAAGALLAVHTYTVKYTAQIYLEALPMFTATVAVLAYMRAVREETSRQDEEISHAKAQSTQRRGRILNFAYFAPLREPLFWWALSAVALGLTAAGKYVYAVAGLAIAVDYLWRWRAGEKGRKGAGGQGSAGIAPASGSHDGGAPSGAEVHGNTGVSEPLSPLPPRSPAPPHPSTLLAWGALALLVFYAANPNLWPDPVSRLWASVAYHAAYSQGAHVAESGYPWWQPFVWLFTAQPVTWHPGILFTPLDGLTAALGVLGIRRMWGAYGGNGRVIVLWWGIGLLFLLLWSTKWPQYSLIMTAPICLCAAEGLRGLWARLPSEMKGSVSERRGW